MTDPTQSGRPQTDAAPAPNRLTGKWIRIGDDQIRAYAALTDDFNPIHLDPDFAAKTPLGAPIAYGTLSLAHLMRALQGLVGARVLAAGNLDIRFLKPVFVGDRVRTVIDPDAPEAGRCRLTVEREDGEAAISGIFTAADAQVATTGGPAA